MKTKNYYFDLEKKKEPWKNNNYANYLRHYLPEKL
jgi:hypothetical protein